MATVRELTHKYPDHYADWLQEVASGETLLGFANWLEVHVAVGLTLMQRETKRGK